MTSAAVTYSGRVNLVTLPGCRDFTSWKRVPRNAVTPKPQGLNFAAVTFTLGGAVTFMLQAAVTFMLGAAVTSLYQLP